MGEWMVLLPWSLVSCSRDISLAVAIEAGHIHSSLDFKKYASGRRAFFRTYCLYVYIFKAPNVRKRGTIVVEAW